MWNTSGFVNNNNMRSGSITNSPYESIDTNSEVEDCSELPRPIEEGPEESVTTEILVSGGYPDGERHPDFDQLKTRVMPIMKKFEQRSNEIKEHASPITDSAADGSDNDDDDDDGAPSMIEDVYSENDDCDDDDYKSSGRRRKCISRRVKTPHNGQDGQIHRRKSRRQTPQLWSFLLNSLCDSKLNPSVIEWVDKRKGIFKLNNNKKIAQLWGERTGKDPKRPMNYEKFSRAIRYYYKQYVIMSVSGRLTYQFGPNACGWKKKARTALIDNSK